MLEEILTNLEFVVMGIWIFVVLFFSYKINNRSSQKNNSSHNKGSQEKYEYPDMPENQTEFNISEEERKLKEWLNDVFGTNIEVERPEPIIYEKETIFNIDKKDDVEELIETTEEKVFVETPKTAVVANGGQVFSTFSNMNKSHFVQGVIMSEILGKPRAINPFKSRYVMHNK